MKSALPRVRAAIVVAAIAAPCALVLLHCGATETPIADRPVPVVSAVRSAPPAPVPAPPSADVGQQPPADAGVDFAAMRACASPRTTVLNTPKSGVVFNNAMTAADAGYINRAAGVVAAFIEAEGAFRCCFDAWTTRHLGKEGELMLSVTLSPEGAPEAGSVDPARSSISDATVAACVVEAAKSIGFPPSPTHSSTTVEYPFRVVARGE